MCLYPKLVKNRKYIPNKKNKGIIPEVKDPRVLLVPIGCGKCMECKKQKSRSWNVRLQEEIKHSKNGKFITLTFSNESIINIIQGNDIDGKKIIKRKTGLPIEPLKLKGYNLDNEVATIATRRFLESWRKTHKKSLKHWFVTELGHENTERIHIHGIVWTNEIEEISKKWQYGIVTIGKRRYFKGKELNQKTLGYVNEATINYIVKYVNKTDLQHSEYNSIILTSSGIGKKYTESYNSRLNKFKNEKTDERYTTRQGIKLNLPIYFRNKLYTEEEKEQLWLNKLNKNIRWVCGEKIDMNHKDSEKNYYNALEWYRKQNKKFGYGNDEINWELKKYQNQIRNEIYINKITNIKYKKKEKERIEINDENEYTDKQIQNHIKNMDITKIF